MADLPIIVTAAGLQPRQPADIRAQLVAGVAATNPGYTSDLPGSLIEDISSTEVAGIAECDSALVELVNSLTPAGANAFLLAQLGQMYGVDLSAATNTSVSVVFTAVGSPGFVIAEGFTVSDGTYQYTVQDGGVIGSNGSSDSLFAVATQTGSWAIPAGTVTQLITSVPSTVTLSCVNPLAGTPATIAESETDYRSRVLQAGLAASQGMARYLKTLLGNIAGVQSRLVSVRQNPGGGWEVICGGGDPYKVAYAIYRALFDISTLVGSTLAITGITQASNGVITTALNHNLTAGSTINIAGVVGMTQMNNRPLVVTVVDENHFTVGLNTTGYGAYVSGGVITPNPRNASASILDYPDTYLIPFVNPPQQTVNVTVTWNTTATNFVSSSAVAQAGVPALVDYVNNLPVGVPMNLFELQAVFQASIANILPPQLLTRMIFAVSINGIGVSPQSGTGIIAGDPESYFLTDSSKISISQG